MLWITILTCYLILGTRGQENAGSSVSKSLIECYNKTENLDRDRRPSSSITVLIDLLRKIESGPSLQNSRLFSKELIHRFKQDGIVTYSQSGNNNPYMIPYTPKGMQSDKHKLLLKVLVPGNAVNFPNETLTEIERCSMHFMLSDSTDLRKRNDEGTVCKKLDRYQRRVQRSLDDDVEVFDTKSLHSKGNLQEGDPTGEGDKGDGELVEPVNKDRSDAESFSNNPDNNRNTVTFELSDCPVENGAVYTKWGAVQAGNVLAGIAAGLEPQKVKAPEGYTVDNIYAATLAGDLAEVTLHQGAATKQTLTVGADGGWNGTQVPRWYFIQKKWNFEMTDAEIRGGLDGLILGMNIKSWQSKASNLRLSQLLDMYYSPRGAFSKKHRACNRKELLKEVAGTDTLLEQTTAFSFLLNEEAKLAGGSMLAVGIEKYSKQAVEALNDYIPSNLQDLNCVGVDDTIERASTNILIVLDTRFPFDTLQKALAYLLDNIDVNKYGSNYTIINAQTGAEIVNSSYSILDFYEKYNLTINSQQPGGFDVPRIFDIIETRAKRNIDENKKNKKAGGQSTIALFVPYGTLSSNDNNIANDRKEYFKRNLPDLKLLVLGKNSIDAYSSLVVNTALDGFILVETFDGGSTSNSINSINPLIARIKQIHRRIINPSCDSTWSGENSGGSFDDYVEPNGVNYYRIAPNYVYGGGTRKVKVRASSHGSVTACFSKQDEKPSQNETAECKTLSASTDTTFELTDICNTYDEVHKCPPAYLSVAALKSEESTSPRCTDDGCRFPDNVKYTIHVENFGCTSGSQHIIGSLTLLIIVLTFLFK